MKVEKWDHQKISRPGMYSHVPMEAYHGDICVGPSVSSSGLRTIFTESPAHYFVNSYLNQERQEQKETEALILGRAAHHMLLGEDDFSTTFIVRPEKAPDGRDWNGNNLTCKTWLAEQDAMGRTVLSRSQIERIRGMAKCLTANPLIASGLLNGRVEQSLIWQDKETGIYLKCRPDVIPNDSGDVADLKSTSHYGYDFDDDASWRRYDLQAVLAKWAFKEVLGIELQSFSLVPVTTQPPHCCDVLTFHGADLQQGEEDLRMALRTFTWCLKNNTWFGPGGTQSDARFLVFNQKVRERAEFRRDFLKREIEDPHVTKEPSQLDYAETP